MPHLDQLLERTSRTFALCIPLLPQPAREEVRLAYLLFRIADTFEDAAGWSRERRIGALEDFSAALADPSDGRARRLVDAWMQDPPTHHDGYLALLSETPAVLAHFGQLGTGVREVIRRHVRRTATGMAAFVARADDGGRLQLSDLADLQRYCYVVAGIVGEMLTELYVLGCASLRPVRAFLMERAAAFGEGLQLTNILKDAGLDATEGRRYLPQGLDRSAVFALARRGLEAAARYVLTLQEAGAPRGIVAFNALPLRLAWPTLERVERHGPGSKLSRAEVFGIISRMNRALDRDEPAVVLDEMTVVDR